MAKKCCVADCLFDAVVMPQVKLGPVFTFIGQAEQALSVRREEALRDELVRQRVLKKAQELAYQPLSDLACCNECMPQVAKHERCKTSSAGALQFVPVRLDHA
jgi:hypothetical protein